VAWVVGRMGDVVVVEDPIQVEEVARHREEPCLEEEASMIQVVEAFLQEIHDLGALGVCLTGEVALVA